MRIPRAHLAFVATAALGLMTSREAHAGDLDPTPERLIDQPSGLPPGQTCQSVAANPGALVSAGLRPQELSCRPNNAGFANMISELGFAVAPSAFYPARTTGIGGFQVSVEASYTNIHANRSVAATNGPSLKYWQQGTRGPQDQTTKQISILNSTPDSLLQIYSLKARKGLGLGFEIAGSLGYIANTSLWVGGADLRWSLLEGFRTGALGYVPDLSVGGGIRTVTGSSRFSLSTVGIDVRASKPITLQDSSVLIPSLGVQRIIILGDSNVVDATPNVDAVGQCGFAGVDANTGAPTCRNKLSNGADANTDFANNFSFDKVRIHRNRGLVALNYRYEIIWLGSQLAFDLNQPQDENPQLVGKRQWTLSFDGGVYF